MKRLFGKILDNEIYKYTIAKANLEVDIINYGAIIADIRFPDARGVKTSLVLRRTNLSEYLVNEGYYGSLIGRVANRIENGRFVLNGKEYRVNTNEKGNTLHGGKEGFDKKIWQVKNESESSLTLYYRSPDMEEGFPGNLDVTVTYSVNDDNSLTIEYRAVSDKDTVVNLTNHSYFNLNGSGSADGMKLSINADKITLSDENNIPHGEYKNVIGTPYDFRAARTFEFEEGSDAMHNLRGCYDDNYVINGEGFRFAGEISSDKTGIAMKILTDRPGIQIYTGNKLGIALETQDFPNAVNCREYPSPILRANEEYRALSVYKFENSVS